MANPATAGNDPAMPPSPFGTSMDTAAFVDLLLEAQVLRFGDFVTKSGRATPYFLNFGNLGAGSDIDLVGQAYADHLVSAHPDGFDVLFGPAYKGIPLVIATSIALHRDHGMDVAWCTNRKEAKDHGEGGVLMGHVPTDGDRVVIVEDVTTAGTSVRETVPLLAAAGAVDVIGLVIAVDRRERHTSGQLSALEQLADEFDLHASAITDIDEVVDIVTRRDPDGSVLSRHDRDRIDAYRAQWGVG